jgi:predicted ATPase
MATDIIRMRNAAVATLIKIGRTIMTDQHQVNSIIATAICDARNDHPDHRMDLEEAKQIAKCVIQALTDAGLQIVPVSESR